MNRSGRSARKHRRAAWKHDYWWSSITLVVLGVLGVLVVALSGSDHDPHCKRPDIPEHRLYRPIEARHYGTPAGAPYSRVIGGRSPSTYWTNDTTPVDVTDAVCDPDLDFGDDEPHRPVTTLFGFWGQFITHMIAQQFGDPEASPVFSDLARFFPGVRPSQSIVDEYGQQQINFLDPYLAGSAVYGHELEQSLALRLLDGTGRMNVSVSSHHDGPLPMLDHGGEYLCGDARARENLLLTSLHTLFLREHNYWAERLHSENSHWDEDRLYNTARHIVIGEIQSITYHEWLPVLLGTRNLFGHDACFRSQLRLTIRNEFAAAAMRMGHSLIPNHLEARDSFSGALVPELEVSFADAFEQPHNESAIYWQDVDPYLLGALYQRAEFLDTRIAGALVTPMGMGGVFNLGGFNVARGRDHGLPSYQEAYEDVTGDTFQSIVSDLTSNPQLAATLNALYNNGQDPIDLWIGILAEDNIRNAMMGVVGVRIVAEQFAFMRDADPYYYEWDDVVGPWRNQIHATRLVDLLRRNTDIHEPLLQGRSFFH